MKELSRSERALVKSRTRELCKQFGLGVRAREMIIPALVDEFWYMNLSHGSALRMFTQIKREQNQYDRLVSSERIRV